MTRSAPSRHRPTVLLLAVLLAIGLAGCDSDEDIQPDGIPGEQQAAVGGGLLQGEFGDIPVPTAARGTGGPATQGDAQTQSYAVTATAPEQVMTFYEQELPPLGWTGGDRQVEGDALRAIWRMRDAELLVVASPDTGDAADTELRLVLTDTLAGS